MEARRGWKNRKEDGWTGRREDMALNQVVALNRPLILWVQVPVDAMGRLSESSVCPFKCLESGQLPSNGTPWTKGRPRGGSEPAGEKWRHQCCPPLL